MTPAEASALKRDASARILTGDERFLAHLAEVRSGLAARGVSGPAAAYMEDLLVQVGGWAGWCCWVGGRQRGLELKLAVRNTGRRCGCSVCQLGA